MQTPVLESPVKITNCEGQSGNSEGDYDMNWKSP